MTEYKLSAELWNFKKGTSPTEFWVVSKSDFDKLPAALRAKEANSPYGGCITCPSFYNRLNSWEWRIINFGPPSACSCCTLRDRFRPLVSHCRISLSDEPNSEMMFVEFEI